jgi:hypothetical protein
MQADAGPADLEGVTVDHRGPTHDRISHGGRSGDALALQPGRSTPRRRSKE